MDSNELAIKIIDCLNILIIEQNETTKIDSLKKAEVDLKNIKKIEKIVKDKFSQSNESILSDYMKEPYKYKYKFEFENNLQVKLNSDENFKNQLEPIVELYKPALKLNIIENGFKGPQGNKTTLIPLGELVFCTQCDPPYIVNLRTKGQRCPTHNEELKRWNLL